MQQITRNKQSTKNDLIYIVIYTYITYIFIFIYLFTRTLCFLFNCHCTTHTPTGFLFIYLPHLLPSEVQETTKNVSHLHKQQLQVNVPHVTPVDHFAANKFSNQQHLQALKPGRPLQFFTKSLAIVTMSSTY